MTRVGFVVNPIAGMGGRVGLKGTDGKVAEARERGAERRAPQRGVAALRALRERAPDATVVTWGGEMGEAEARDAGFDPVVAGEPAGDATTAADTREAVEAFVAGGPPETAPDGRAVELRNADGVALVLFVGGDGTAVDVAETLDELDADTPMLGAPAGVKVYSSVFAVTPRAAGRVAADFDRVASREVNDIDESAYRDGEVRAELRAVANVPVAGDLQASKQTHRGSVDALAEGVAADVASNPDVTYVLGPGSTVGAVADALGVDGTPLGVDAYRDGEIVARDASEADLLDALGDENCVVVSPIGGQGFIFGRGNDQISPAVVRQSRVEVVASRSKLDDVGVLRVDTGDPDLDDELRGWTKVRVGRYERRLLKVA